MGKKIIIKGADFSENRIYEILLAIDCNSDIESAHNNTNLNNSPFADTRYAYLFNKHLVGVEFIPVKAGTLTIVSLYDGVLTDVATINITSDRVGIKTYFDVDITIRQNEIIGIGRNTDTGNFSFYIGESAGFIVRLGSETSAQTSYGLAVNWYVD